MRNRTSTLTVALTAMSLWLGCDQATNATYRGPALAELHGRMSLKGTLTHDSPVRLAVVWYPLDRGAGVGPTGAPTQIATDELAYSGVFPQEFTLQVFDVPSLKQPCTTVCALGAVVAYQDLNGNGRLDVATDGALSDHVVGSSWLPDTYPSLAQADQQALAYFDKPTEWTVGTVYPAGFSLVRVGPDAANAQPPPSLNLNLVLQEEPRLDLLTCRDFFFQPRHSPVCGVAFIAGPRVEANFLPEHSTLTVHEGPWQSTDAQVWVNGVAGRPTVPPEDGYLVTPKSGDNLVRVELPGYPATEFHAYLPAAVLAGLADGQLVDAGTQVELRWDNDPRIRSSVSVTSQGQALDAGASFTMPAGDAGVDVVVMLSTLEWGELWRAEALTLVSLHLVAKP